MSTPPSQLPSSPVLYAPQTSLSARRDSYRRACQRGRRRCARRGRRHRRHGQRDVRGERHRRVDGRLVGCLDAGGGGGGGFGVGEPTRECGSGDGRRRRRRLVGGGDHATAPPPSDRFAKAPRHQRRGHGGWGGGRPDRHPCQRVWSHARGGPFPRPRRVCRRHHRRRSRCHCRRHCDRRRRCHGRRRSRRQSRARRRGGRGGGCDGRSRGGGRRAAAGRDAPGGSRRGGGATPGAPTTAAGGGRRWAPLRARRAPLRWVLAAPRPTRGWRAAARLAPRRHGGDGGFARRPAPAAGAGGRTGGCCHRPWGGVPHLASVASADAAWGGWGVPAKGCGRRHGDGMFGVENETIVIAGSGEACGCRHRRGQVCNGRFKALVRHVPARHSLRSRARHPRPEKSTPRPRSFLWSSTNYHAARACALLATTRLPLPVYQLVSWHVSRFRGRSWLFVRVNAKDWLLCTRQRKYQWCVCI